MDTPQRITGSVLVGGTEQAGAVTFAVFNPATGEPLGPVFHEAHASDVQQACGLAAKAFGPFSELAPVARARFLHSVGSEILALGEGLIDRAMAETGLPRARLEGERARTVGQLGFFADIVRAGSWMDVTIDQALPGRTPAPRPDLRRRHVAIGPVAVFGASNFPLAFSVAGGDTASALAAGCPVVVKGHPAHAGTGELVARAVLSAVDKCGLPVGTFSYLPGKSQSTGTALVANPQIRAVGFTGSRAGGLALARVAANRPEPIPLFAEMSSINPVILFPAAARARGAELGRAYVASVTQGSGQFCTSPGVVLALEGADVQAFVEASATAMAASGPLQMLASHIHEGFVRGAGQLSGAPGVQVLARGDTGAATNAAQGVLFEVEALHFMADAALREEVFGPASLIVRAQSVAQIAETIDSLEGQLTATVLFDQEDLPLVAELLPRLEKKVGRIICNGWPTGVEVCHAMVHGGPFPATTDVRSTSVGSLAIQRFLRPVCYQNMPDALLPASLRSDNPLGLPRRVDGTLA